MKEKYFKRLESEGVVATGETTISPTQRYSERYDGVTVKFEVNPGTSSQLIDVGVSDGTDTVKDILPSMSTDDSSWQEKHARFKGERQQINIGLGTGTGLEIFNDNIVSYKEVSRR